MVREMEKGFSTRPDGTRYEGDYKNDMMTGQKAFTSGPMAIGTRETSKTVKVMEKAVFTSSDGRRYEGDWKDDKKHGKGVQTLPNGNQFEGEWKDGTRNPTGRLTYPNGAWSTGHISDDMMKGAYGAMQTSQVRWTYTYQ